MAKDLHPTDNAQALIDRLVITGLAALVHGPLLQPMLYERNRDGFASPRITRVRFQDDGSDDG